MRRAVVVTSVVVGLGFGGLALGHGVSYGWIVEGLTVVSHSPAVTALESAVMSEMIRYSMASK